MGNEIGEIGQIINTSVRGIEISVRVTKEILSMLKRLIEILEAATFRRGLRKTSGKTLASTLKMKGNVFSAKMSEDVYEEFSSFLRHKGKKYGIQWADGPTLEKGFHRVFIAEADAQLYKTFLEDYAKKHCKSSEEKENLLKDNSIEDLYTYMDKSGLKECTQEEYERAQEKINGPDWKERVDLPKLPDKQKKNLVMEGIKNNKWADLKKSGNYQFIKFSKNKDLLKKPDEKNEIVIADPAHDHVLQLTFQPDYVFAKGEDVLAAVPNDRDISVQNLVNGEDFKMTAKEYVNQRESLFKRTYNKIKQWKTDRHSGRVDVTISKMMIQAENENQIKIKMPGMYVNNNEGFLWINKKDTKGIHYGKNIHAFFNKEEKYNVFSATGHVIQELTGDEIYFCFAQAEKYANMEHSTQKNTFKIKNRKNTRK